MSYAAVSATFHYYSGKENYKNVCKEAKSFHMKADILRNMKINFLSL